jgi:outer membrane protein assembly factor BamD (BamD/ComL family)
MRSLGASERFRRAAALESTDPATALAEYAALAREEGPWGANALYAQARLELELGHTGRARTLLERYLARYPSGVNAEDARALLRRLR